MIRTLCSECKKKIKPNKEIKEMILKEIAELQLNIKEKIKIPEPLEIYTAQGCKKCGQLGFLGRIALFEVLSMSGELAEIILKDPSETKIIQEANRQGMITMKQDGIRKVLEGVTTIEEVLRVAEEIQSETKIKK